MQTNWENLVTGEELVKAKRTRSVDYLSKTIFLSSLSDEQEDGWKFMSEVKKNPKKVKVMKQKPQDEVFENTVWVLLANMGFTTLNRDQHFVMYYGSGEADSQQIDVFAADDETILFVECKSAISPKAQTFKKEIEALAGKMNGLRQAANKHLGGKRKCKFIFATNNYGISDEDKARMESNNIAHFDEKTIAYYQGLVKHLGTSARYQLLGNLFANLTIAGMDNRIPAIRGKMGGHTYYSFSIEPEKLLKIGYVLHHSEADRDTMPTYQRLIKKSRLNSVRKFINDDHGYFPNSIVISIDTKKQLRFDASEKQVEGAVASLGILHLPQKYRSVYIIDGQHRLYGYSDSPFASKNSIPVVAFENLDHQEQVRLFMEINENQKSVPKRLRNLLNANVLWDSDKEAEKREALCIRIARDLGERMSSPLYGLVDIEDEQAAPAKNITIENINKAISTGNFLAKFDKKNVLTQSGIFDMNNSDITLKLLYGFLEKCLTYIKDTIPEEWERSKSEGGILTVNNGMGGMLRVINDIASHLVNTGDIVPTRDTAEDMAKACEYYLDPVCRFIQNANEEIRTDIRKTYGSNGPIHCWRYYQRAIHTERSDFLPDGMEKYWEDHNKENNVEAIAMIAEIEKAVKKSVRDTLEDTYGSRWVMEVPTPVYTAASTEVSKAFRETGEEKDFWDFVNLEGCKDIILYGRHWSQHFEEQFTLDSERKKSGGKGAKTEWLTMVYKLQSKAGKANFSVPKSDYQLLCEIKSRFAPDD
jgi:DNA sulfur modification protein DndB